MSFNFKKINRRPLFELDTENFVTNPVNGTFYFSLKQLYEEFGEDHVYPVYGLYINTRSEFGDAPVAALEDRYANLPEHLLDTVEELLKNSEAIAAIKEGKCGFTIREYVKSRFNKTCYTIDFCNI